MSWFKIKSKVDVNSNRGDTIKNSQVVINGSTNQKDVILEIYYKIGKLETNIKNIYHDINEIKGDIKTINDTWKIKEADYTFGKKIK